MARETMSDVQKALMPHSILIEQNEMHRARSD